MATYGNYITFDATARRTSLTTLSNGNRTVTGARTPNYADSAPFNMALPSTSSELFYMEVKVTSVGLDTFYLGVSTPDWPWAATNPAQIGQSSSNPYAISIATWGSGSACKIYVNGSVNTMSTTMVNNDRLLLAIKPSTGKVWVGMYDVSGTSTIWMDSSGTERTSDEPGSGTNATGTIPNAYLLLPGVSPRQHSGVNGNGTLYAEEGDWIATVPNGAKAIATQNLPTPAPINYEDEYYIEADISHSNGSTTAVTLPKSVSGGAMARIKRTDSTGSWYIVDTVRGANKYLLWDTAAAEDTSTWSDQNLTGTTLTLPSALSTGTYLVEIFYMGDYFDIAVESGTGSNRSSSHAMGNKVGMGFWNYRTSGNDSVCYHKSTGATGWMDFNDDRAFATLSTPFNNTEPTATTVYVGSMANTNASGTNNILRYLWADAGPYAFGSYTGTTSGDGAMISVNGSPTTVLGKPIASGDWWLYDQKRDRVNVAEFELNPNTGGAQTNAEDTLDFLSKGFKMRRGADGYNGSGKTYIYGAFGIQPLTDGGVNQGRADGRGGVARTISNGGVLTFDGDYAINTFSASGTISFEDAPEDGVEYLVIAGGGGGGGSYRAGGGGAGGYRTATGFSVSDNTSYAITVGAGGNGGAQAVGADGANSVFSSITSTGGGGGGTYNGGAGRAGGSGGGGAGASGAGGGRNATVQGNVGGAGHASHQIGGGGGGAGAAGNNGGSGATDGDGGVGLASSISGSSVLRSGGGGAGSYGTGNETVGGLGGGGKGGFGLNNDDGTAGTANTGGGGGGSGGNNSNGDGGAGGSGVVIIRYKYQ